MLMAFTVGFALLGHEIKSANTTPEQSKATTGNDPITTGGRILIGGFLAGGVLIAVSHAGDAGAQFATGLALVSAVTATLVYGGPVWSLLSKVTGSSTPTTPTSTSPATSPTKGA